MSRKEKDMPTRKVYKGGIVPEDEPFIVVPSSRIDNNVTPRKTNKVKKKRKITKRIVW